MIFEAKVDDDFQIFGTFRPLGTSAPYWAHMADLPTAYAELHGDHTEGVVDVFDNPELDGSSRATIPVTRLME